MSIEVNGKVIETDEEGYLLNPEEWDEDVARAIAEKEGIELTEIHWGLIRYFRDYYEEHKGKHPSMAILLRTLGKVHGDHYEDEKAYEKFLYSLFPTNPVAEISKLAGIPKAAVLAEEEN